jgi:hypothetical protein
MVCIFLSPLLIGSLTSSIETIPISAGAYGIILLLILLSMFLLPFFRWLSEHRVKQLRFKEYINAAQNINPNHDNESWDSEEREQEDDSLSELSSCSAADSIRISSSGVG